MVDRQEFLNEQATNKFHENPYYRHIYKALKTVKNEISKTIDQQKSAIFESEPLDFASDDEKSIERSPGHLWKLMYDLIFNIKGDKDLKRAIDNMYGGKKHDQLVFEAFAKGHKPPLKLTENEKAKIL